jgi:hypothetical protein
VPGPPQLITRRAALGILAAVLAGVGDAVLSACKSRSTGRLPATGSATATPPPAGAATPTPPTTPPAGAATPTPPPAAVVRAGGAEQALIAAYDRAILAHPALRDRLVALRSDHVAHLLGLLPAQAPPPVPSPVPSTAGGSSSAITGSSASGTAGPGTSDTTQILTELAAAERSAAAARVGDVTSTTGAPATLLASIGGCEAAHAALLTSWSAA